MLENLGEFHCTCRFYRAGEFVPAVLIPESECGYHSTMRKRSTEADGEAVQLLERWLERLEYSDPYLDKPLVLDYLKRRNDKLHSGDEQP